jgi:hypothetical protein
LKFVYIKKPHAVTAFGKTVGEICGDAAFAHTAFAAHDQKLVLNTLELIANPNIIGQLWPLAALTAMTGTHGGILLSAWK